MMIKKLACIATLGICFFTACGLEDRIMEEKETVLDQEEITEDCSGEKETTAEGRTAEEVATEKTTMEEITVEETAVEETTTEETTTEGNSRIPCTFEEMNEMGINDFNEDVLYMDKVRVEDFSYLYEKGMTYEDHVSLQARLTRYLDYYIPTEDEKVWQATVIEDDFVSVPALDLFYIYIEELDAVVECKCHRNDAYSQNGIPYTFSCEKIEMHDPNGPAEVIS